ncbi:hypothetical protein A8C32_10270 [Flavivirga aquatica]|uniref:Secretion system C-terminal sorting domain-containing protein n=2 Tax=Flavivirga aquatica TaxID=1849968 RepID=A0A1E5TET8_9FLAO|nr:hypothetical protein A8C32_10270 [Flavivirga aquatica]
MAMLFCFVASSQTLLKQQRHLILGERTVLVIRGVDPATDTWKDTDNELQNLNTELNNYVKKISFNKAWIANFDITPVYNFTVDPNNSGYRAMGEKLADIARSNGYDVNSYNVVMYIHKSSTDFKGAGAWGGGNGLNGSVWANNSLTYYAPGNIHETMHAFGMGHAEGIEGGNNMFPGNNTGGVDPYFFMGSQGAATGLDAHINSYMKYFAGWIDKNNVVLIPSTPSTPKTYRIHKSSIETYNTAHNYAIQLGGNLWLSYEPDNIKNTNLQTLGLVLHNIPFSGSGVSKLLDTKPNSITKLPSGLGQNWRPVIDFWDAAMTKNEEVFWNPTKTYIKVIATGGTGDNKWVDVSFSKNSQGTLSVSDINLGLDITISPNPTTDFVNIKGENDSKFNVKILDLSGKLILNEKQINKINISHLANGIYILKTSLKDTSKELVKKIIKK